MFKLQISSPIFVLYTFINIWCFTLLPQAQSAAVTASIEVDVLKSLAQEWSTTGSNSGTWNTWNLTGDPGTGQAIDGTDIIDTSLNSVFKCNCNFNNGSTCHVVQIKVYQMDITGQIPAELANLTYLSHLLPRTESMKVHFLGILVLTAVLLETTDAVCNKRMSSRNRRVPLKPCRNLVFYYHDILYNGSNDHNATSALVAAPKGDNLTALASNHNNHFGQMVVFDDPLTLDNNLHSPPVARAQGFYFYDMKNIFGAWFSFTIVLDSKDDKGTITLAGADPATVDVRDMLVVGGTGDFLMTRGIATLTTDTFQGEAYFRLRLNITLYECH